MASLPARIIDQWLLRPLRELLSRTEPSELELHTGRRLARIELVTIPEYCKMIATVPPDATEVRFEDMPACKVEYVDYYDQNGVRIIRAYFGRCMCPGDTITVYTDHVVSTT